MKLLTLTLLLAAPNPLTFLVFVFLSAFFFSYAVLNHLTNYRYQLARPTSTLRVPTRVTNAHDQRM